MKSIYILLTKSTTICSRIIYLATRSEFTHASISLDSSFNHLYTFARKYRHLMLPAGFTVESVYRGIMGDSDDMKCAVYELKISDKAYEREDYFFCSQFVYKVLTEAGAIKGTAEPSLVKPMDLSSLPEVREVFKDNIRALRVNSYAFGSIAN